MWKTHFLLAAIALCGWLHSAAAGQQTVHHELTIRIDPAAGALHVTDRVTLPDTVAAQFTLNAGLVPSAVDHSLEPVADGGIDPELRAYRVRLPPDTHSFQLSYRGRPRTDGPRGADTVLAADNVILDPSSTWYPDFGGAPVRFDLRVQLPAGWRSVSQGENGWMAPTGDERWRATTPQQGIYLVAAEFSRYRRDTAWGRAEVYLRSADEALARGYLDATAEYLGLYSRLIGTYPYPKFALVENARQTGYGMPSFTLLGSRVIRLPFIVHTSYPHEILHNWWGNGVWVAYDSGNWAEALTTYLADYLLAEQRGRGMEQRRAALQKYADFVAAHNDFPLRNFRARHGEASQAIGYSKGMMFFHMLRRQLGDQAFVAGLRQFYRQFRYREASFTDLQGVFEQVAGGRLETDFRQWLERAGAPELSLNTVDVAQQDGRYRITVTLQQGQDGAPYRLEVPIAIQVAGHDTALMQTAAMTAREQTFEWEVPGPPLRVAVDPAFDLFRRLDPRELPPSLGRVQGARRVVFVLPGDAPEAMRAAYHDLARQWARAADRIVVDEELESLPAGAVWILGRENRLAQAFRAAAQPLPLRFEGDQVEIAGNAWRWDTHSLVLAAADPDADFAAAWISASSPEAVAALARKLPHYSRYGYLVFAAAPARNVAKGEWPVADSPLQRTLTSGASEPLSLPQRAPLSAVLGPGLYAPP